jgi:uncharacterized membrane protein YjgN (DUF898 family)
VLTTTLPRDAFGVALDCAVPSAEVQRGPFAWRGDDRAMRDAAVASLDVAGLAVATAARIVTIVFEQWHMLPAVVRDHVLDGLKGCSVIALALFLVHRCWARLALRQQIWSAVRLDGVPLTYTGTLRELIVPVLATLAGLLMVFAFFTLLKPFIVPRPSSGPHFMRFLVSLPLVYLMGLGIWRARTYLVSRTSRAGARGVLDGSAQRFAALHFVTMLATPLTFGWMVPVRQAMQQRQLIGGMSFGPKRFTCDLDARMLLRPFAAVWAGAMAMYAGAVLLVAQAPVGAKIALYARTGAWPGLTGADKLDLAMIAAMAAVVLGVLSAWYKAQLWRQLIAATQFADRALRLDASTIEVMQLILGNAALRLLALGPLAEMRTARFLARRVVYASG